MKYKLHGFYQFDYSSSFSFLSYLPQHFEMEFKSVSELARHIEGFNFSKGTFTFVIEVTEEE